MVASNIPHSLKKRRKYLAQEFNASTWESLLPIYEELAQRPIYSAVELERWILDCNELDAAVNEEFGWRYIKLTTDTTDAANVKAYEYFIRSIVPNVTNYAFQLNKKLISSPFLSKLDKQKILHLCAFT